MPDPALIELIQHLAWQPPAIVRPAATEPTSEFARAYEQFVTLSECESAAWSDRGRALRASLWERATSGETGFDVETLGGMIMMFERSLLREARELHRLKKEIQREERLMSPAAVRESKRLNDRMLALSERFFAEETDFALFLRALRAELDRDTRGGATFDDPDELERYLLSAVA